MAGKTISTTITHSITLGSAYPSPLTILSSGEIAPATTDATGIMLSSNATFATIINHGKVFGGGGGGEPNYVGGPGGIAIELASAATLNNTGDIIGGGGYTSDTGGGGGTGILALASATLVNSGLIAGGAGAYGHYGAGAGGVGIDLAASATLTNSGTIRGGDGGYSYLTPSGAESTGGIAVNAVIEAVINNTGVIAGGLGGAGGMYQRFTGNTGGTALVVEQGGTLNNSNSIYGGGGGISLLGSLGGIGGIGVYAAAAAVINGGFIAGGLGGLVAADKYASTGGAGGTGVIATNYAAISNYGGIAGGAGGAVENGGAGGEGVTISGDATLNNIGRVYGGAGGYSGVNLSNYGGVGGTAVAISSGTFINHGQVAAGAGGYANAVPAMYGPSKQFAGDGGIGIVAVAGTEGGVSLANYGAVTGGAGGYLTAYGTYASYGTAGTGGTGVVLTDVSFANHGTVTGGAGGVSGVAPGLNGNAGVGGVGVVVGVGASLLNSGTITGGAGGTNVEVGVAGGDAVVIAGGTVTNGGTIEGGAGGVSTDHGARGDAVYFAGSIAGTLILNPGAVFGGLVAGSGAAANVIELTGTSATVLSGFGTEFVDIPILSFASGAQRGVEGSISGFGAIDGFAPHDSVVLDGYTAVLNATEISSDEIVLFNSMGAGSTLDVSHPAAKNMIISDGNGKTTITAAGMAAQTIGANHEQFVLNGGTATGSKLTAGGFEQIALGGTAAHTTIAGGTLQLDVGASVTGGISFSTVTGGKLIIESVTMPSATIAGFIAGDTIKLAGVVYNSNDSVTVTTAGTVTIKTPGMNYKLTIAGATVGETDFRFGSNSLLTRSAAASPKFIAPADRLPVAGLLPASPETALLWHPRAADLPPDPLFGKSGGYFNFSGGTMPGPEISHGLAQGAVSSLAGATLGGASLVRLEHPAF